MAISRRLAPISSSIGPSVQEGWTKVLYVEDNEMNFDIARSILDDQFSIDWAASSDQGSTSSAKTTTTLS